MTIFELTNKIHGIRSYIASDWPNIEERKRLYIELEKLEKLLKEMKENDKDNS